MRTNGRQSTRRWRRGTAGALRSEALVEEATAPACVLDRSGRIIVANHALEQLLGVAAGGLGGRTLPSLAYPPDEELANAAVQQVLSEGLDRCQVEGRWVRVFSRELVWGSWDLSLVRDRRGRPELAIAMVRDLTAMKRSEHERRFFQFMFKLIGEADSSHQVLTAAVQTICHFTRCAMGQVWLPAGGVLVCSPTWYCSGYGFEKLHAASEQVRYELGQGLPGLAWAKGQPLQLDDIRDTGRFDRAVAAQRAGVREAMAVPVTGAEGVVAVLELFVTHERAGEPGRLGRIARAAPRRRRVPDRAVDRVMERPRRHRLLRGAARHHRPQRAEAALAGANRELGREGNRYLDRMADSTMYMQQLIHDLIGLSRAGRSGVEPIEVDLRRLVQAIAEDAGAANPRPSSGWGASRWSPATRSDSASCSPTCSRTPSATAAGATWWWWSRATSASTGASSCRSATTAGASRPSTASGCSGSSSGWRALDQRRHRDGLAICRKIVEVLGGGIGIEGDHGTDVRIVLPAAVGARWPSNELTAGSMR
jgi:PAS domain S-box-containing protein